MAGRPPMMLPKAMVLLKLERIQEILIALGQALEETEQTEAAAVVAECIKDMTGIYATVEQL